MKYFLRKVESRILINELKTTEWRIKTIPLMQFFFARRKMQCIFISFVSFLRVDETATVFAYFAIEEWKRVAGVDPLLPSQWARKENTGNLLINDRLAR